MPYPFTADDLDTLAVWDTPTICNGLELIVPERRAIGFTTAAMVAAVPEGKPIVGLARVGCIRAKAPPRLPPADRLDWYDYVAGTAPPHTAGTAPPHTAGTAPPTAPGTALPTVIVMQDLDDEPGYGAWWGEVHSTVHKALGALGCVTNGSFRDTAMLAPGFQIVAGKVGPSHAHVHLVEFGNPVTVFGMDCAHDDVVHADAHGAVIIPASAVCQLPAAIALCTRRERVILDVCADPAFTPAKLRAAVIRAGQIH